MLQSLRSDVYPMIVDGREMPSQSGQAFETKNPSTGRTLALVAEGGEADIATAVAAARRAFEEGWSRTTPKERSRLLLRWAEAIRKREQGLAEIETADVGRPISSTRKEMAGVADSVDYYAGVLLGLTGETLHVSDPGLTDFTLREPLGVCGLIAPWNYPALLAVLKMAPALAAGNTVVLKPSELAPLSSIMLGEAALEAGFPPGVVNVVPGFGDPAGMALVRHPDVAKISFTGGTVTGKRIYAACADTVKRMTLELGGKSPLIVFADADLEAAVAAAYTDNTRHAGQVCAACTRLIVDKRVEKDFVDALGERLRKVKIGPSHDSETEMGPLISERQQARVEGYLEIARNEGADVQFYAELAGRNDLAGGYFLPPALLLESRNDMTCSREEIFGPVQSVISFADEDDAIRLANESPYGLAAAVYTRDTGRAMRVTRQLQAGTVCVNAVHKVSVDSPFGGYKQSGIGKERGIAAMLDDTQVKNVRYSMN